ncbi:MAG TPA: response regulator [Bryobacteraceae bacterium]|jgi:DNA-binding response OmpR family regulator|nr:response regulator [Bryobacteraceae bacterium]
MPRKVLIVEDTPYYASALEIALSSLPDVVVSHAPTGGAALEQLEALEPGTACVILTDLHMPLMDGFELIERLRSGDRHERLPVIVLSGDTDPETPGRIRRLGADAFFAKPYSPTEVRNKVEELLNAFAP